MSSYVYNALGADEIRLITLRPGNHDDAIWLKFSHHLLGTVQDESISLTTLQEVQMSLPAGWRVFETLERRHLQGHHDREHFMGASEYECRFLFCGDNGF